jgi:hypothetical protein
MTPHIWDGVDEHDRRLGEAMEKAGFSVETVNKARQGRWSDFKSPLDAPKLELVEMLRSGRFGNQEALAQRVIAGEFDG